jgi:hemoglobin
MKRDIENRADIEILVNSFYEKVKEDKDIGFFFTDVVNINWDKHLPIMYNFWENILFNTGSYSGNPMEKHIKLNKKSKIKMEHFQRWTNLFNSTVDSLFEGINAEMVKQRALSIATVMQIKILAS